MKKKTAILTGVLALAAVSANAAPLFSIGDNLDIFFDGKLTGQYNTNVTSAHSNKIDDYALIMSPGIVVNYGRNSKVSANLFFREDFIRYLDNAVFNQDLTKVYFDASYKGDPLSVYFDASFVQNYQNTPSAVDRVSPNGIIRNDVISAGIKGVYKISDRTSAELGFRYNNTRYVEKWDDLYNDWTYYKIPVAAYYALTSQLDVGLFFTYTRDVLQNTKSYVPGNAYGYGRNRDNYFGGASVRIKSWERLSGLVNVGVTSVQLDSIPGVSGSDSNLNFGLDASLSYEVTQKISLNLLGYQNYSVGAAGQNIENKGGALSGRYQINQYFDFTATLLRYTHSTYEDQNRADDTYTMGASVGYSPTSYLRFTAGYTYFMNSSDVDLATYNMHLLSVSASLRY